MREQRQSELTGVAGEHVVTAQLLLRGLVVYWPSVDRGCDLLVENGARIQVKSAHLSSNKRGSLYFFPLPKQRKTAQSKTEVKLVPRKLFAEICDFVVFWGIEQNRFWIVPAALCDSCTGVELGATLVQKPDFFGSISDMREMKGLGYSNCKIAKHYGITATAVRLFLNSGRDFVEESAVSQMRSCENDWEKIVNFVRSPAVVEARVQEE